MQVSQDITDRLKKRGYKPIGSLMSKEEAHCFVNIAISRYDQCLAVVAIDCQYIPCIILPDGDDNAHGLLASSAKCVCSESRAGSKSKTLETDRSANRTWHI